MNIKKQISLVLVILFWTGLLFANPLTVFVESHRYLDSNNDTVMLLDYQIPYRAMTFLAQHGGYFAELQINIRISQRDSLIYQQEFTDNVGIRNRVDASSSRKSYLNRLSYILDEGNYQVFFAVRDKNSQQSFERNFELSCLYPESWVSDVELSSAVRADSTQYLSKFRRNGILYQSEPSGLFNTVETDFVNLYFEIYSQAHQRSETAFLTMGIERADSLVIELFRDLSLSSDIEGITLRIPLAELEAGAYTGSLSIVLGEREFQRSFQFAIQEDITVHSFLFPDPDEEVRLMRYFIGSRVPANWQNLNLTAKRNYISNFWAEMAARYQTTVSSVIDLIRGRIDYSNNRFSYFQPGWTTDRGRIYIRNGAPDELEEDQSSDDTRFVRKDFQIWKYRSRPNAVYLFIDMQMSGNYRLMYVSGDEMESTNPSWQSYLGDDFDMSKIRN